MTCTGSSPSSHAASGQPQHAGAFPAGRRRAPGQLFLARLAEEDHAEELDHGVAGQRRHQRDQRRHHRDQHGQQRHRQAGRKQEALQQQPLRDKTAQRRQPGAGQHASSVSQPTQGMVRIRPPSLPRLRSAVACSTLPVPRNSRLLKKAWLATWYSVAVSASAAIGSHAVAEEDQRQAHATNSRPMFSIDE
jgi:hypothetical protein